MKLGLAIEQVASAERKLADELLAVGERHSTDHDVHHLTQTLAKKERAHVEALAEHASRYGASVGENGHDSGRSRSEELLDTARDLSAELLETAREKGAELLGRRPEPALLLLRDLRRLHVLAAGASLDWVALAQGAEAAKDTELLATVSDCHEETLKTLKWTTYRVKEAAPQALTT